MKGFEGTTSKKTALFCCAVMGIVGGAVGIYIGFNYASLDKNLFNVCCKAVQECGGTATYITDKGVRVEIAQQLVEATKAL